MRRLKVISTVSLVLLLMVVATPRTSEGHKIFEKEFEKHYGKISVNASCTLCHVAKEEKTVRNGFGKLFAKEFDGKDFSKKWTEMERDAQKKYETDEMAPAFRKAIAKVKKMKNDKGDVYDELIKGFKMEGIKEKKKKKK